MRRMLRVVSGLLACLALAAPVAAAPPAGPGEFFKRYCLDCHDNETKEAQVSFEGVGAFQDAKPDMWAAARDQLQLRLMPPKDADQPTDDERQHLAAWIAGELRAAGHTVNNKLDWPNYANYVPHESLFGANPHPAPATSVRVWRKRPAGYMEKFPGGVVPFGMLPRQQVSDYGVMYPVDESAVEIILGNATQLVEQWTNVEVVGGEVKPLAGSQAVPWSLPLLHPERDPSEQQFTAAINQAYVHALDRLPRPEELARLRTLYDSVAAKHGRMEAGRGVLVVPLLSPECVYRIELGAGPFDEHGRRRLTRNEIFIAIKNTLGVGRTGPIGDEFQKSLSDKQLTLESREEVAGLVRKLLGGDKPGIAENARVLRFFDEFFDYEKVVDVFKGGPPPSYHAPKLAEGTKRLIARVVADDRDVFKRLLTTREAIIPEPEGLPIWLLYNLPADSKKEHGLFELSAEERCGILTQPSWLAAHSTNFENDPVRRGKWILEHLLGGTVPEIPVTACVTISTDSTKPLRERLVRLGTDSHCLQCHNRMNGLGMPLEAYDQYGRLRLQECRRPVDTTGGIIDSGDPSIDGPVKEPIEMIERIARSPRSRQMFVRYAFRYFLGRNETVRDAKSLQEADEAYQKSGGSMKALVVSLMSSDSFLYRTLDP